VSLWAVVPAFNEEERIEATVAALYKGVRCDRVVVVDDGSHDATGERARRAGAAVVPLSRNGGKGRALRRGIEEVLRGGAGVDVLLLADADLGPAAARLVPLVQAVREQGKDLAIASFSSRGGFGLAKRIAAAGIYRLTGRLFASPLSGQRALSRRALDLAAAFPAGWGVEVAMTVKAIERGLDVIEVPIALSHRETGKNLAGFFHRGRQCGAVLVTLGRLAWERRRKALGEVAR
jgi:Glycosyltransferases involved in cell wall biogenesis